MTKSGIPTCICVCFENDDCDHSADNLPRDKNQLA